MNPHPAKARLSAPFLAVALIASPALHAQGKGADRWRYEASPSLWAAGVDGTTRLGNTTFHSSSSFSDLLSRVDFGVTGAVEARRGRWGVLFDAIYIRLSDDAAIEQGTLDVKITQQMYSLGGAWRALEGNASVDLVAGLRYNYIKPKFEAPSGASERKKDALDPFVGARARYPLSDRWSLVGYFDVGTYSGSDTSWQILAGADYELDAKKVVKFGYRRLQTKYNTDALGVDTTIHGLYVGMGFRF
jgi:opacity protein-like surface antigen